MLSAMRRTAPPGSVIGQDTASSYPNFALNAVAGKRREELSHINAEVLVLAHTLTPSETSNLKNSGNWVPCFGFRSMHPGITQFLFCDGHTAGIKDSINRNVYRWLSTRSQGEIISSDAY